MAKNTVIQKILEKHIVSGNPVPGEPVSIRIDQTLTQDATGTMAYLELEAMNIDRVKTELSVSYVDHNMMQNGPETATTTCICRASPQPRAWFSRVPATAFAIRCIWNVSASRARPCWGPIPILPPTAASA